MEKSIRGGVRKVLFNQIKKRLFYDNYTGYFFGIRSKAINGSLIAKLKYKKIQKECCSSIPLSTKFNGMPTFPHGINGILISEGAVIGSGCVIFHQVTIGSNTLKDSKSKGSPTIGDNVYIGCGAKIIGGIKVGNNVRIGANCVVTKDIRDNCTVVLSEPRIIVHSSDRDNTFVDYHHVIGK